jgi:hypothetical protein
MAKVKRRPLDRAKLKAKPVLRKEWVSIEAGDVCVWGMTAAEMLSLGQRAQRPAVDPRGGMDTNAAAAWLVALCTREDDSDGSPRVWDDISYQEVFNLSGDDFQTLSFAAQRVNGQSRAGIEALEDFIGATEAPNTSGLPSSVSNNSGGSPASSDRSLITS